jgi:hypothetical protein
MDVAFNPFTGQLDLVGESTGGGGGDPATNVGSYTHLGDVHARDVVYLSGPSEVGVADADGAGTHPVIGFCKEVDGFNCVVQYSGEMGGFPALTPRKTYYLSTTGISGNTITETPPDDSPAILQKVGTAKSSTVMLITVDQDFTDL